MFNSIYWNQMAPQWPPTPYMDMLPVPFPGASTVKVTPKVNNDTARPLIEWFERNLTNPYPSDKDMENFRDLTGFTYKQIGDWFRNKRRNYKHARNGNVPWSVPSVMNRKRNASSMHYDLLDSSSDSISTARSSPAPSTSGRSAVTSPNNSHHSETSTDDDNEVIDVVSLNESTHPSKVSPSSSSSSCPGSSEPAVKQIKLWSVHDMI